MSLPMASEILTMEVSPAKSTTARSLRARVRLASTTTVKRASVTGDGVDNNDSNGPIDSNPGRGDMNSDASGKACQQSAFVRVDESSSEVVDISDLIRLFEVMFRDLAILLCFDSPDTNSRWPHGHVGRHRVALEPNSGWETLSTASGPDRQARPDVRRSITLPRIAHLQLRITLAFPEIT